ncbi:MAG: hypothetical protein LBR28_04735 [Bacteroidales bacterium]|jgi:hypothetical protein|nr:hypothetical protein [Bacteroidales bacterium]
MPEIEIVAYKDMTPKLEKQLKEYKLAEVKKALNNDNFLNEPDKTPQIYRLDSLSLTQIAEKVPQSLILLVTYNYWCVASTELFDSIINMIDRNKVALILISTDDWSFKEKTQQYLTLKNYFTPSFMLDIEKYGCGLNFNQKFLNFSKKMFPSIVLKQGLNTYILLDKNLKIISYGNIAELHFIKTAN